MQRDFYAHGKLLISGEYLVLKGALALAVPTVYGQHLSATIEQKNADVINWTSFDNNGNKWFNATMDAKSLQVKGPLTGDKNIADTLRNIIIAIRKQQPQYLLQGDINISTKLEFPNDWGLGSSATLLTNLCKHANADAMIVNAEVFKGSGYDIATAQANAPILFRIDDEGPVFDSVNFFPPQHEQFRFVHLGEKQNSRIAVEQFLDETKDKKLFNEIETISEISEALLFCDDFSDFMQLLDDHEEMMQYVLQEEKIKTARFNDFPGVVKSLGAWGGDFVLAAADMDGADIDTYFKEKGLHTVISYAGMVLSAHA